MLEACTTLRDYGYKIYATSGTAQFLAEHNIESEVLHWPDSGKQPNAIDYIEGHKLDLVINIPKNFTARELANGFAIRRSAIDHNIPLITNARLARAFIYALCKIGVEGLSIRSWNEY
jgi:carbamoyl-phosphate synthase large subunit